MAELQIESSAEAVSTAAAELTAKILNEAIAKHGQASWLLSGGTAPIEAYRLLASQYTSTVDWGKVVVAIGDERCVPFDSPYASWPAIERALLSVVGVPENHKLRPKTDQKPELAAEDYQKQLTRLIAEGAQTPTFDLVWLGMGEDGHTLSLFPEHPGLDNKEPIVIAVHDSPKPPPERISLTLKALICSKTCLIMVAGAGKSEIIAEAFSDGASLPINQAVSVIEAGGGKVTWLIDQSAAARLK